MTPKFLNEFSNRFLNAKIKSVAKNLFYGAQKKILQKSGLFNEDQYFEQYLDLDMNKVDPLYHFVSSGWKDNRNPSFDILSTELKFHYSTFLKICPLICPLIWHMIFRKKNIENPYCNNSVLWRSNMNEDRYRKIDVLHKQESLQNIAYVGIVRDEEDIIYENLCWHYSIGFRKFVIIDHNSTDSTVDKIKAFRDKSDAQVILINDATQVLWQNRKTTSAFNFVVNIWPEVEWVFPTDADEFWCFEVPISEILAVSKDIDAIITNTSFYSITSKNDSDVFYRRMLWRYPIGSDILRDVSGLNPCVPYFGNSGGNLIIRSSNKVLIEQGNHSIRFLKCSCKSDQLKNVKYIASSKSHVREYSVRSRKQVNSKFKNLSKASKLELKKPSTVKYVFYQKSMDRDLFDMFVKEDTSKLIYDPLDIESILI